MANCGRCQFAGVSRPGVFGQDVDLNIRVFVPGLRPVTLRLRKHFEPGDTGEADKFLDSIGGKNDVDVLRHSTNKPMPPNRPAIGQKRRTLQDVKQVIDCLTTRP